MPKCQLTLLHTYARAATCVAMMTISGCMASVVIVSPTTSSPANPAIYNPVPINLQLTDFCGPLNVQLDGNTVLPAGNWQQITAQSGTQSFTGLLPALTLATPHTLIASEGTPQSGSPPQACPPPNSGGQGLATVSSTSVTFTVTREAGIFSTPNCKLSLSQYSHAGDLIYTPDGYFGTALGQVGGTGVLELELGNLPLGGSIRFTPGYVQVLGRADALLIDSEASGSSLGTWTFFDFLSQTSAYTNPKLIVPIHLSNPGGIMGTPTLLCSPDGTVVMVVDISQTQVGTGPHAPWNLQHSTVIDLMSATFMTCGYQDGGKLGAQILQGGDLQVYSGFLGSGTMFSSCSQ